MYVESNMEAKELSKNQAKFVKSLKIKKYRNLERLFLVEGAKNVLETIHSSYEIEFLISTSGYLNVLAGHLNSEKVFSTSANMLAQLGTYQSNGECLAVVRMPDYRLDNIDDLGHIFMLDGVRDPGNLGTIIRTMDWFGFTDLICSEDTADLFNPKVVNATKGSFTRVRVHYTNLEKFIERTPRGVYVTKMEGESLDILKSDDRAYIIMGSESHGVRPQAWGGPCTPITIPRFGQAESLNVAIAAGIICSKIRS